MRISDWSSDVCSSDLYARELARTGRFEHADQPQGPGREGENLWTGTRNAYGYDEMVAHWVDEKRFFTNGITPDFSTTGDYRDAVHYAQIVWRGTQRMGRSEEPTSDLQSLMRISSAVFCLKKKIGTQKKKHNAER